MRVPLLNFKGGPGVPLLNFEGAPGVPYLNFKGGLGSRGPGSWGPDPTFPPCRREIGIHWMQLFLFRLFRTKYSFCFEVKDFTHRQKEFR